MKNRNLGEYTYYQVCYYKPPISSTGYFHASAALSHPLNILVKAESKITKKNTVRNIHQTMQTSVTALTRLLVGQTKN